MIFVFRHKETSALKKEMSALLQIGKKIGAQLL